MSGRTDDEVTKRKAVAIAFAATIVIALQNREGA